MLFLLDLTFDANLIPHCVWCPRLGLGGLLWQEWIYHKTLEAGRSPFWGRPHSAYGMCISLNKLDFTLQKKERNSWSLHIRTYYLHEIIYFSKIYKIKIFQPQSIQITVSFHPDLLHCTSLQMVTGIFEIWLRGGGFRFGFGGDIIMGS